MSRNFDFSQAASKGITVLPDLTVTPPAVGHVLRVSAVSGGNAFLGFVPSLAASAFISDTPPAGAADSTLWWDSSGTGLYIRYNDGTSTQWVVAENQNTLLDVVADGQTYGRRNGAWINLASSFLPISGGALTGPLILAADPTAPLGAATRQYVNATIASGTVTSFNTRTGVIALSSADVTTALTFTPYNATNPANYQTATQLTAQLAAYAPIASPVFTGVPIAPTAAPGASTTQLATTQFVAAAITAQPAAVASFNTRTGAVTLSSADVTTALTFTPYNATNPQNYQTAANVTASLAPYALLASPTFTGTPTLPAGAIATTQAPGTSNTTIATTAFVANVTGAYLPLTGGSITSDLTVGGALNVTGTTTLTGPLRSTGATSLSLGTTTNGEVFRLNDNGTVPPNSTHGEFNYIQPSNAWQLTVNGTSGAAHLWLQSFGTGQVFLRAFNATQFATGNTGNAVNYVQVSGSTGTNPVLVAAVGTGTNLDISLTPKGTGGVRVNGPIGFNSNAPLAKPAITGAKAANAALASLLTALASYGLITDSTTA